MRLNARVGISSCYTFCVCVCVGMVVVVLGRWVGWCVCECESGPMHAENLFLRQAFVEVVRNYISN